MKKLLFFALFLISIIVIWVVFFKPIFPPEVPLQDALVVGTSADFKPFTYKQGEDIVGFDIDIIQEVGRRLNKHIIIKDMPFELLMPQLQLGTIHVIAAGMTITPERAQQVIFTQPYLTEDPLVIISLKTHPLNEQTITHKKIIVNQGYTADLYLSKRPDIDLVRLPTMADAILALRSRQADAFVTAANTIKPFLDQQQSQEFELAPLEHIHDNTALAISKQHPQTAQAIQQVIQDMIQDGTIEHLKKTWL